MCSSLSPAFSVPLHLDSSTGLTVSTSVVETRSPVRMLQVNNAKQTHASQLSNIVFQ